MLPIHVEIHVHGKKELKLWEKKTQSLGSNLRLLFDIDDTWLKPVLVVHFIQKTLKLGLDRFSLQLESSSDETWKLTKKIAENSIRTLSLGILPDSGVQGSGSSRSFLGISNFCNLIETAWAVSWSSTAFIIARSLHSSGMLLSTFPNDCATSWSLAWSGTTRATVAVCRESP